MEAMEKMDSATIGVPELEGARNRNERLEVSLFFA
jgi:hypothetical protein